MDDRRFDDLARAVAIGPASRRTALRLLIGGAVAALLTRPGVERAAATHGDCRHLGERCTKAGQCCSSRCKKKPGKRRGRCACPVGTVADKGACIPRQECSTDEDCANDETGKVCTAGLCKCPAGEGDCNNLGTCGPLGSDPNYCGACDVQCADYQVCTDGTCGCPPEQPRDCGDACKECCGPTDCVGGTCNAAGTCTCPSTVPVCNRQCCVTGETCLGTECGACPQGADLCDFAQCGDGCVCATDDQGNPGCFDISQGYQCVSTSFGCAVTNNPNRVRIAEHCCSSGWACVGEPCGE